MALSKDIELVLTMLAKATPTKLHQDRDSHGFNPLEKDARGVYEKTYFVKFNAYN